MTETPKKDAEIQRSSDALPKTEKFPSGSEYFYRTYVNQLKDMAIGILSPEAIKSAEERDLDERNRRLEIFSQLHGDTLEAMMELSAAQADIPRIEDDIRKLESGAERARLEGESDADYTRRLQSQATAVARFVQQFADLENRSESLKRKVNPKSIEPFQDLIQSTDKTLEVAYRQYQAELRKGREDWRGEIRAPQSIDIDGIDHELDLQHLPELDPRFFKGLELIGKGGMGLIYKAIPYREQQSPLVIKVPLGGMEDIAVKEVQMGRGILRAAKGKAIALAGGGQRLSSASRDELDRQMERMMVATRMMTIGERGFFGIPKGARVEVMPLVNGDESIGYLDQLSESDREIRSCEIMAEIAKMVQMCHDAGVVHRDIKPENFLIDIIKQSNVEVIVPKLADFGLAKEAGMPEAMFSGTPAYMSPDLLNDLSPAPQHDVYALGVSLYTMLTGDYEPYGKGTPIGILSKKMKNDRTFSLQKLREKNMPAELVPIIVRATKAEPGMAEITAGEIAKALEHYVVDQRQGLFAGADVSSTVDELFSEAEKEGENSTLSPSRRYEYLDTGEIQIVGKSPQQPSAEPGAKRAGRLKGDKLREMLARDEQRKSESSKKNIPTPSSDEGKVKKSQGFSKDAESALNDLFD